MNRGMATYQCTLLAANEPPTLAAMTASTAVTVSAALKMYVGGRRPQNLLLRGPGSGVCDVCAPLSRS